MTETSLQHIPVMLKEVLETLQPRDGGVYIDGTFGAGGYTRAILATADCIVYAIDRDPDAIVRAKKMAADFPDRLFPIKGCFGDMQDLLSHTPHIKVDGIVLDLGVSSMQLDTAARGFSFRSNGPLDMRMGDDGPTAADIVNSMDEKELADILYTYGEEKASRKIARKIVESRNTKRIETTAALTDIIHEVLPMHGGMKTDTATRSFQALRIYINDELGELERALEAAENMLLPGGRLVVVTFHSLEDRRVKHFLKERSGRAAQPSRHLPAAENQAPVTFMLEKAGGIKPDTEEVSGNLRARSARLRYAVRTGEAAHV